MRSSRSRSHVAPRAIDNDPDSAWLSERYRGDARLGRLKPGVGEVRANPRARSATLRVAERTAVAA